MQYMLLIYGSESLGPTPGSDAFTQYIAAYTAFTAEIKESGAMIAGDGLQGVATATTVSVRNGKTEIVDGPFAETKEQFGGYYLIEAKDLDEATLIAAKIPTAKHGRIEIRPVMVFN
ncbi:MAG: YciI family protein [Rhizobiales bacterium]|nr:YciI family protein [Hyphomicrobiales bacterium]NRB14897.1 YciI family protein [Hyphomicrobiales bacterium]